jgi:hypothetical protein
MWFVVPKACFFLMCTEMEQQARIANKVTKTFAAKIKGSLSDVAIVFKLDILFLKKL